MSIERIWNEWHEKLFCSKTNMYYDLTVGNSGDANTAHLPTPEAIALQIPNPNGWGTGMEDSVLTAGSVMDAVVARYTVSGDCDGHLKSLAGKVFDGMKKCADIPGGGFLARSISPADGKSFYFNSSRDQYTHFIYGAVRFYRSGLADEAQKADISRILVSFAEKAKRDVTPENNYILLRYDGKPGIVSEMWGNLGGHEYFRLPMFYLAAWYVTNDEKWYEEYMKYRDEAFEKSVCPDVWSRRVYPVLQMQYSLRLAYDTEKDESFRKRIADRLSEIAVRYNGYVATAAEHFINHPEAMEYEYQPWNKYPARLVGIYGGYAYYNPGQYDAPGNNFWQFRNVGEALTVLSLSPLDKVKNNDLEAAEKLASLIDKNKHHSYAPLLLACGYYTALENIKK